MDSNLGVGQFGMSAVPEAYAFNGKHVPAASYKVSCANASDNARLVSPVPCSLRRMIAPSFPLCNA